jgi:hypothetical protein
MLEKKTRAPASIEVNAMKRHMLVYLVGLATSSSVGAAEAQSANPAVAKPASALIDSRALAAVGIHATPGSDGAARRQSLVDAALPGSVARGQLDMVKASAPLRTVASNADERAPVGVARATASDIAQRSAILSRPAPEGAKMNVSTARAAPGPANERALSGPVAAVEQPRASMAIGAPAARSDAARLAELAPSRAIDANQDARSSMAIKAHAEPARPSKLVASGAARRPPLAAAQYGPIVHARPAWKR